jgi:hypothetical protein
MGVCSEALSPQTSFIAANRAEICYTPQSGAGVWHLTTHLMGVLFLEQQKT